jgi:hypothetical protein
MQRLNSLVETTDAVSELLRGRYFRQKGGTTGLTELTKKKFECTTILAILLESKV